MRKLAFLLAALLALALPARAQAAPMALEPGRVMEIHDGDQLDLFGDGAAVDVRFEKAFDEDGMDSYALTVGGHRVEGEGVSLTGKAFVLRLDPERREAIFFVSEYGPSSDDYSYAYCYDGERLTAAGGMGALPEHMTVSGGQIHAKVRASILFTWFRPGDFVLAHDFGSVQSGAEPAPPRIVEAPRAVYPVGVLVTTKVPLTLYVSPYGDQVAMQLPAGTPAAIAATDDRLALYIEPLDSVQLDGYVEFGGGWVTMANPNQLAIDGDLVWGADAFDGLFFAD